MSTVPNGVSHGGIAEQFVQDWQAAAPSAGRLERQPGADQDWRPYVSAASRALRRLIANLELVRAADGRTSPEPNVWSAILDETRRLLGVVPPRGTVDQATLRAFWKEADALIARIDAAVALETKAKEPATTARDELLAW